MNKTSICFGFATAIGLLPMAANPTTIQKKGNKPNIIYILADDLGRAEIGSYGQQLIETPNMDRLSEQGLTFSNHYSGTAVSAPSRCVLFTGLHTGHAYIRGNDEMASRGNVWSHEAMLADSKLEGQAPVPANTVMIPAKMKEAGYKTACVGKWGLGYPGSTSTPNKMGFDFFYGYNCQRQAHNYYPPFLYRNEEREYLPNNVHPVPHTKLDKGADPFDSKSYAKFTQKVYAPDVMYDEIIDFVRKADNDPFVLFWTTPVPHVPLQAPQKWIDYYVDKFGDEEPYLAQTGYYPARYPRATYAAMVSYFDEQIGGLIEQLKKQGVYENTIIMITSDNGPSFNGGASSEWFNSAKPFKNDFGWVKASLREGGIRTPLIVSWPKHVKPGESTHISAFWDMMPTFCDIAGIESPKTDGISMLPVILGKEKKQGKHDFLYWEYPEMGGQKAVRMGKWKAFIPNIFKGGKEFELYDLEVDPREHTNIAKYHPEIVEQIKEIMRKEHTPAKIKKFNMPNL